MKVYQHFGVMEETFFSFQITLASCLRENCLEGSED